MSAVVADLELDAGTQAELIRGFRAQMTLAEISQRNVGAATRALGEARPVEGLGIPKARIDADIYWRMRQRFGAGCWKDTAFLDSYLRHNEGARVPVRSRKVRVGR